MSRTAEDIRDEAAEAMGRARAQMNDAITSLIEAQNLTAELWGAGPTTDRLIELCDGVEDLERTLLDVEEEFSDYEPPAPE